MNRLCCLALLLYCFLFACPIMARSPRPPLVDQGLITLSGNLNEAGGGQLSDFTFEGMSFTRSTDSFVPNPSSGYRVELKLTDGSVVSANLLVDRSEASHLPIPAGTTRLGSWQVTFPAIQEAKGFRILFQGKVVFSMSASNEPFPYIPVLTQIDKSKVRIGPAEVEDIDYTLDGGKTLQFVDRVNQLPGGILTLPSTSNPNQPPIVMADVIAGMRRHTTWVVLDPNFVPPQTP